VTQPAAHARDLRFAARRFAECLKDVADEFVGRDEVVRVLGLATLCREHVLLVGPPGTAKTSLLDRYRRVLDVTYFGYLLSRFTEPAELFGTIDVARFQNESVFQVNTEGMLPRAHVAFLDEVFQGSSAILNTLLTLINERTFHNGPVIERANLLTLLGSTNELPTDPSLAAFSDRFLLRCTLDYVAPDEIEDVLAIGWRNEQRAIEYEIAPDAADSDLIRFSLDELQYLQRAMVDIEVDAVRGELAGLVRTLRQEGVELSDRRAVKAQKLVAASALLGARRQATREDLGVLVYLWTRQGDDNTIRRVLEDVDIPAGQPLHDTRELAALELDLTRLTADGTTLSLDDRRDRVLKLHRLLREAARDYAEDADLRRRVQEAYATSLEALRRHRSEEDDYV
jgi:MoxR-like ATPase